VKILLKIGLIGMPGAGKGECARIAKELGIAVINMGDLIREHTKSQNLELTDENIGSVAHSEREKFNYGIWAERTVDRIEALELPNDELLVIDGIRGDAEVEVFKGTFGDDFKTVAIQMSENRRFELLKSRNRSDAPQTWEDFKIRDEREARWGIQQALELADYILCNSGTLDELKTSLIELFEIIKTSKKFE
jgi:dephospho-CoA kinase